MLQKWQEAPASKEELTQLDSGDKTGPPSVTVGHWNSHSEENRKTTKCHHPEGSHSDGLGVEKEPNVSFKI